MRTKIELIVKPNPNPEELLEILVVNERPLRSSLRRICSSGFMPNNNFKKEWRGRKFKKLKYVSSNKVYLVIKMIEERISD